jgi:lysophospholipase L1-like esterase
MNAQVKRRPHTDMLQPSKFQRYALAAFVVLLAAIVSPIGIETLAGRADVSFRIAMVSSFFSAFLLLVAGGIVSGGRVRTVLLHAVFWTSPFVLLACIEVAAIAVHLSDRIATFEDLSPLASGNRYPNNLLSEARMYTRDGLTLYRPYEGDGIRINKLGLRTAPPAPEAAGEWRVAVTGGSATWGWHVLDADTIADQLHNIVRVRGQSNVTVYNFGIEGAGLQAEIALLKNFSALYKLDQVIFYTGANDAFSTFVGLLQGWSKPKFELVKAANRLMSKWLQLSPEALADMERRLADKLGNQNSLRTAMADAVSYCATAGLRCDFALQPTVFDLRAPVGSDREMQITGRRLYPSFDTFARKMYDEALVAVPGDHVHDFRDTFDRCANPVFLDFVHTNELGYRLVAERIASRIPIVRPSLQSDVLQ